MIHAKSRTNGFTIIELIVIIVVIGILVAITIVSYAAITNNAKKQVVQTDARTVAAALTKYKAENGGYPSQATFSTLNISSVQATFQYTYNSTAGTYCVTASVQGASAYIQSGNSTAKDGGCFGHGVNGQSVVLNLAYNPSAETNYNGVVGYYSSPLSARSSIANAVRGSYQFQTVTDSVTYPQGLIHEVTTNAQPGQAYRCSISLRGTAGSVVVVAGRFNTSTNGYISEGAGAQNVTLSGTWQRVSINFTTPANTAILLFQYRLLNPASGITIQSDALMCTQGGTNYNYADGTTPGWTWETTAHGSASSGPAQ